MNSENIKISILTGAEHYTLTQSPRKGYILITDLATTPVTHGFVLNISEKYG